MAAACPERPTQPGSQDGKAVQVLVVDDEASVLRLELAILKQLGLSALGVNSGDEAVRYLSKNEVHAIVSDSQMPGAAVDGPRLYEWVHANRPVLAQRFVFVTGYVGAERRLPAGVRVLLKPFKVVEYAELIRSLLGSDA